MISARCASSMMSLENHSQRRADQPEELSIMLGLGHMDPIQRQL